MYLEGLLTLGEVAIDLLTYDKPIVHLLAMPTYNRTGKYTGIDYLDYAALESSLKALRLHMKIHPIFANKTPVLPYHMEAGNAGGNWERIVKLLDKYLEFYIAVKKARTFVKE